MDVFRTEAAVVLLVCIVAVLLKVVLLLTSQSAVDSDEAILVALRKVAAKIVATCEFKLKEPPQDPGLVNVYFDDLVVPRANDSWTLEGDTVRLVGESCRRVMDGEVLSVRIIAGCPTVAPR